MRFDDGFNQEKSEWTKRERGIDFVEAREIFKDPISVVGPGTSKNDEERWLRVGMAKGKLWTVGYTIRANTIRIFMARPPRKEEKEAYFG